MATKTAPKRPAHKAPAKAPEQVQVVGARQEFDNSNRGALFENDKKGVENRPDMTGSMSVTIPKDATPGQAVKFYISAWQKTSKAGNDFLSIAVKEAI